MSVVGIVARHNIVIASTQFGWMTPIRIFYFLLGLVRWKGKWCRGSHLRQIVCRKTMRINTCNTGVRNHISATQTSIILMCFMLINTQEVSWDLRGNFEWRDLVKRMKWNYQQPRTFRRKHTQIWSHWLKLAHGWIIRSQLSCWCKYISMP